MNRVAESVDVVEKVNSYEGQAVNKAAKAQRKKQNRKDRATMQKILQSLAEDSDEDIEATMHEMQSQTPTESGARSCAPTEEAATPKLQQEIQAHLPKKTSKKETIDQMVAMFEQVKEGAAQEAMSFQEGKWESFDVIVDSGATIPVLPAEIGRAYPVVEGAAKKAGVSYKVANGNDLPNLGEKTMAVWTSENTVRGYHSQVADVTKPLQSVRALLASDHTVVF